MMSAQPERTAWMAATATIDRPTNLQVIQRSEMNNLPKLCLFALVCSGAAFAQATLGSGAVGGLVHDTYGDGMPDTIIEVTNEMLGVHQSVTTTDDGIFRAASLPAAAGYKLKASHNGFVDFESDTFTILAGGTFNFRIGLQEDARARRTSGKSGSKKVGAETDDHQLSVDTPTSAQQLENLPVKQRKLLPLVQQATALSSDASKGTVSILGQPLSNETYTDGIQTSNGYFTRQTPGNDTTSLDSVGGLQVMSADAPAEFRDGMSGVINSVTRSGTENFHGTAYEYLRLNGLTANGRYALGHPLLHAQNQTGGSVMGPILADRLFFFTNLEVLNNHFDGWNRITSPLIADPSGSTVAAANCKASAALCANAIRFIQSQMNILVPLSQRSINGLAKLDYQFDNNNRISFAFDFGNGRQPNGQQVENAIFNGGLLGIKNSREDTRYGSLSWVSTPASSAINELRLGFASNHIFNPATTTNLSTGNVAISLYGANIGNSTTGSSEYTDQRYQIYDNFTFSGGPNTFQVGVDWSRSHYNITQLAGFGDYFYESLTNFASDLGTTTGKSYNYYTQSFGKPSMDFPYSQLGVYGQDNLRLNPKLTLNLGLRWEKPKNPQPPGLYVNNAYYQTASVASPNLDLAPRIGAAYLLNSKTTIRGGFGYYYTPFYGQFLQALYLGGNQYQPSIAINPTQTNSPAFPKTIGSVIPGGAGLVMYSSSKLRNPKTQQISLSIVRELFAGMTLTVNGINSRGYKLWTASDLNLASPTKTATYTIDDAAGNKVGSFPLPVFTAKNDNNYSHVYDVENNGSSWYNALAVELRKRMSYGVTLQASYTWSHAIDDAQGPLIAGGIPVVVPLTYNSTNKDSSTTDQRQRLALNATYQPVFKSDSFVTRYLLNGWQLSTIGTMSSGLPETAEVIATGTQLSGITPLFNSTLDGSGAWDRVPFYPVAEYRTGHQYNWNLRFTKTLPFTERVKGLVLFEAFNILNTQWTTALNTAAFTATTGVLHPIPGAGQGVAGGSYPYQTNGRSCQIAFRVTF
jgi:hypothetical protein